jgi:hypothetical protein
MSTYIAPKSQPEISLRMQYMHVFTYEYILDVVLMHVAMAGQSRVEASTQRDGEQQSLPDQFQLCVWRHT